MNVGFFKKKKRMRKRALSESDEEDDDLERVPTVHATLVARLYEELRERGESLENFIADFAAAGYSLKKRTLMRWVKGWREEGEAPPESAKRGRKKCSRTRTSVF